MSVVTSTSLVLAGTVVIESIFGLSGVGSMLVDSINAHDFPVVQAIVLFTALIYVLVNMVVDLLYVALDPRIGY